LYSLQARIAGSAVAALVTWYAIAARAQPSPEVADRNERQRSAEVAQPATADAATDRPAAAAAASPALATFAGGRITVADMQAAASNKDPATRAQIARPNGRAAFLEQLIHFDLLVLEAERRGYGYHPAVLEAGKRAAISRMVERDLAIDPSAISKADVAQHYEANIEQYQRPLLRRASHIEVATEREARALIAELKGGARDRFAKVAGERSHDERTRRQGGELGYFDRKGRPGGTGAPGAVPAELVDAAFALARPGAISPRPIKRASGFSVVMLTGEMPALEQKVDEVEDQIRAELAEQRLTEAQEALLVTLREQWKTEVHPERMDAIELEPGKPLDQPQGFPAAPRDPRAPAGVVEPDGF
jgi:peptidyl-prolyl cis-trans isomerase C